MPFPLLYKTAMRFRLIPGTLLLFGLGWIYGVIAPEKPDYSDRQEQMVDRLSLDIQSWLSELALPKSRAVFGNFANDRFGFVAHPVREALWRSDRFDLCERGRWERFRRHIAWTIPAWTTSEQLASYARSQKASVAIGGSVLRFADNPHGERLLQIRVELVHASTGHLSTSKVFTIRPRMMDNLITPSSGCASWSSRVLAWVVLTLVLPLGTLPFARRLYWHEGNAPVAVIWAGLVLFDVVAAYGMFLHPLGTGWWAVAALLVVFALSLRLNYWLLSLLKEYTR